MKTLLIGCDKQVAEWAFNRFHYTPVPYDWAVGIIEYNNIVGACLYHAYNGNDIEISYYGPKTITLGIVKSLAKLAVNQLGVSRITARTSRTNKSVTKKIKKLGFEYEGVRHFGYGDHDAIMYGLYGKNLARLVGKTIQ
jgi:RimJ/RimL family protein N-acetyltransferase